MRSHFHNRDLSYGYCLTYWTHGPFRREERPSRSLRSFFARAPASASFAFSQPRHDPYCALRARAECGVRRSVKPPPPPNIYTYGEWRNRPFLKTLYAAFDSMLRKRYSPRFTRSVLIALKCPRARSPVLVLMPEAFN